jgi:hypothetical protein
MGRFVISAVARAFNAAILRWADGMAYRYLLTSTAPASRRRHSCPCCYRLRGGER